jgi:5-(carboxyamino)imidazole ribonucleotide mutase
MKKNPKIKVGLIMGSQSDWEIMENAAQVLKEFKIPYKAEVVSAHRTPLKLKEYALGAEALGLKVIIAGAGGAAHLPGMAASMTTIPVLAVPILTKNLDGLDSLLSIVQMPAGVPVHTFAIGRAGAINAALATVAILALSDNNLARKLKHFRKNQTQKVLKNSTPKKNKKK